MRISPDNAANPVNPVLLSHSGGVAMMVGLAMPGFVDRGQ